MSGKKVIFRFSDAGILGWREMVIVEGYWKPENTREKEKVKINIFLAWKLSQSDLCSREILQFPLAMSAIKKRNYIHGYILHLLALKVIEVKKKLLFLQLKIGISFVLQNCIYICTCFIFIRENKTFGNYEICESLVSLNLQEWFGIIAQLNRFKCNFSFGNRILFLDI